LPVATERSTPSSACTAPSPEPNRLRTPTACTARPWPFWAAVLTGRAQSAGVRNAFMPPPYGPVPTAPPPAFAPSPRAPLRQLLQCPGVAVGVGEGDEGSPWLDVDVAGVDAVGDQLPAGRLDVGHHHLDAELRAGLHRGDTRAQHDRAGGAGRGEL